MLTKAKNFLGSNFRYFLAGGLLLFTLFVNKDFFVNRIIKLENCKEGECAVEVEKSPGLSRENPHYYVENVLKIEKGGFYRITFREQGDATDRVIVKVAKDSIKEQEVGRIAIEKKEDLVFRELTFQANDSYSKIFFEKENYNNAAEVFFRDVRISKLNVKSVEELKKLKLTILGEVNLDATGQEQNKVDNFLFYQLREPQMAVGQVFTAQSPYLAGLGLEADVVKAEKIETGNFHLEIQEAEDNQEMVRLIGSVLASFNFSLEEIEKYRRSNGAFLFPLYANLEKGKQYLVLLDNEDLEEPEFNYLILRGTKDNLYAGGSSVMKKYDWLYKIDNDLFFSAYAPNFTKINGQRLLSGAIVEDLGSGVGSYRYRTTGEKSDILDIENQSQDIVFSKKTGVIMGDANRGDSFWTYKIETGYPFKELKVTAEQADRRWKRANIQYSFDQKKWQPFPSAEELGMNKFVFSIPGDGKKSLVYLRISPDAGHLASSQSYGIKNLELGGELIVK
jgi:hypothetical protein